jgi:hypothetical protein
LSDHPLCTPREHLLSRRQWLGAVAGLGTIGLPALAEQLRKKNKQVLMVWLDGGMSQLESWDPKPGTVFGGPFRAIPTSVPGIHVSELLPATAKQMHHLVLVRSLCTRDNSHSSGVERILRGDPKNRGVAYPQLGAAVSRWIGPGEGGLPPYLLPPGRRFPRPEVRRSRPGRRQAAGELPAPGRAVGSRRRRSQRPAGPRRSPLRQTA